jgi:hypothetical protein
MESAIGKTVNKYRNAESAEVKHKLIDLAFTRLASGHAFAKLALSILIHTL